MPSVMAIMNLATLCMTAPTRFLHWEHYASKTDLIQGINIPTPKGTDHTPSIMVPDMGDISVGHSPAAVSTMTEAAVFGRHTSHSSSSHCSSLCHPSADGCPHHHSHNDANRQNCTQSHTHHSSQRRNSCHFKGKIWSHSSNSHCTAQEPQPRKAK